MITSRSAKKFVFGDFNAYEKDWLTYSGGTHRPAERVIIFLSQMTFISWLTLLLKSPTVIFRVLFFWISFFLLTVVFVLQWLFSIGKF